MADRIVYAICDDDCRFPTLTQEQILEAIQQAIEQGYVSDPDGAVISRIKEINANGSLQIWTGTEAEFNALSPAPTVGLSVVRVGADGVLYLCADDTLMNTLLNLQIDEELSEESGNAIANMAVTKALNEKAEADHNHDPAYAAKDHNHDTAYAAKDHTQAASTITAGTLAGRVLANASEAATLENAQIRNIRASTTDLTAGSSALTTGEVYLVYE